MRQLTGGFLLAPMHGTMWTVAAALLALVVSGGAESVLRHGASLAPNRLPLGRYVPRRLADEEAFLPASRATNYVGLSLLRALPKDENAVLSPISISTALAMVYPGANGDTKRELSQSLGYARHGLVNVAQGFGKLRNVTLQGNSGGYTLQDVSALFHHKRYKVQEDYVKTLNEQFGADVVAVDFDDTNAIDTWAKGATKGLISRAVDGPLDPDTQMILMNAVYFKGFWKKPFSVRSTFKGTFLNHGTEPHLTDIMYMRAEFPVKSLPAVDAHAILLPYEGDDAAMLVVLPKTPTGVDALLQALSVTDLVRSLSTFESVSVDLFLPKLEMEASYMLKEELRVLGLRRVFQKGQAELSGIGPLLALSDVAHRARVKVDERGTEAVALTTLPFVTYSSYPTFSVVHPFLFFIVHRSTGTLLFAGKVLHIS